MVLTALRAVNVQVPRHSAEVSGERTANFLKGRCAPTLIFSTGVGRRSIEPLGGAFHCCAPLLHCLLPLLAAHRWMLTVGCSLLAAHCWLLTIGCSLLVAHYRLLIVRYSERDAAGVECTHRPIFSPGAVPLDPAQPKV